MNNDTKPWLLVFIPILCITAIIMPIIALAGISSPPSSTAGFTCQQPMSSASLSIDSIGALDGFTPKTGNGTSTNPYIIQGFTFGYSSNIENIHARYLILRNCIFTGWEDKGLVLKNVSHVTIEGCTFRDGRTYGTKPVYGLSLYENCAGVTVRGCTFTNITFGRGLPYSGGGACYIGSDQFDSNVTACVVANNSFTQFMGSVGSGWEAAYDAIRIYGGYGNTITNNHVSNLYGTTDATFSGIRVEGGEMNAILNNSIENLESGGTTIIGQAFGIRLSSGAHYTIVRDNMVRNITSHGNSVGIYVQGFRNRLSGNLFMGGETAAVDGGSLNLWYEGRYYAPMDRFQSVGNYYWNYNIIANDTNNDYIADQLYNWTGVVDYYPIMFSGLDSDSDGLFNGEETTLGTDINIADTDGDGWIDYDEVRVYGTNPLDRDTDGDGIIDSQDPQPWVATQTPVPDYTAAIQNAASMVIAGLIILAGAIIVFGIMNAKHASTRKDIPSNAVPAKR